MNIIELGSIRKRNISLDAKDRIFKNKADVYLAEAGYALSCHILH